MYLPEATQRVLRASGSKSHNVRARELLPPSSSLLLSSQYKQTRTTHYTILTMSDAPTEEHKKTLAEKTGDFFHKSGEVLHKAVDATILSPYGTNIDGKIDFDGALAKDVVNKVTHPGGKKE
jgi:hypothetical protein